MIWSLLLPLAEIIIPSLINNIFKAEVDHPSPGSGNTKRDVVHAAIFKMITDADLPLDENKVGDLIDQQVQILKMHEIGWTIGAPIINTVIECIVEQESTDPTAPNKLSLVIDAVYSRVIDRHNVSFGPSAIVEIGKFIDNQVYLFNKFGVFTNPGSATN